MKRWYVVILLMAVLLPCFAVTKGDKKKKSKNKVEQPETVKKKVSKYDKLLVRAGVETAKGGFVTVHKIGQKIYFEYPLKYMGREVLLGSTVKSTSDALLVTLGFKSAGTLAFKI